MTWEMSMGMVLSFNQIDMYIMEAGKAGSVGSSGPWINQDKRAGEQGYSACTVATSAYCGKVSNCCPAFAKRDVFVHADV